MISTEQVQARRDALAAQMEQGQQEYTQLEQMLAQLDRSICAMAGGLQELDALLAEPEIKDVTP
jgi:chromosome condensin MukBEF ATPase and DNA-binding subunit MukB